MGNILSSQEESYQLRMKIDALEREERAKQARIEYLEKEKIDVEKEERAKQARIEYLEKEVQMTKQSFFYGMGRFFAG
eukprot:CAMPEP_0196666302 /NCGR_PEP_ID=MMETSP1086-20130531/64434_1 /TAXON_ID=77921 /ORGANISM="Cyanoptyche  gloeocystis , Strain SAG4.97" /LENGTH=77 /DNA_ID=CAMNT_0042003477 /DNA_START=605 /DNA_END=838 /DNA_ORIENTATION=-